MARTDKNDPDTAEAARLYDSGMKLSEIATRLRTTYWKVRKAAKAGGASMRGRGRSVSVEDVVKAFKAKGTVTAAAEALGLDRATVRKKLDEAGVAERQRGRPRIYEIDEEFFSDYTAAACYWAGFAAADGCLVLAKGAHRLQFNLNLGDWAHLESFKVCAGSTHPVKQVVCDGIPEAALTISCRRWWDDLVERFNLTPAKSLTLCPPPDELPERMRWHYLRGLFDGDGGGTQAPKQISFYGTQAMMRWVRALAGSHHAVSPHATIWRLALSGDVMRRSVQLMYAGSRPETRLERKYDHFVSVGMLRREPVEETEVPMNGVEMGSERIIRAKWVMDGAKTLDEAAEKLEAFANRLRAMKEEGWCLEGPVDDDYGTVVQQADSPT